jgi:hypothetical protein
VGAGRCQLYDPHLDRTELLQIIKTLREYGAVKSSALPWCFREEKTGRMWCPRKDFL